MYQCMLYGFSVAACLWYNFLKLNLVERVLLMSAVSYLDQFGNDVAAVRPSSGGRDCET